MSGWRQAGTPGRPAEGGRSHGTGTTGGSGGKGGRRSAQGGGLMGEERDAPEGSAGAAPSPEESTAGPETACVECGSAIETSDWYPIRTDRDEDGDLRLYPFCSEACQAAWLEARRE